MEDTVVVDMVEDMEEEDMEEDTAGATVGALAEVVVVGGAEEDAI